MQSHKAPWGNPQKKKILLQERKIPCFLMHTLRNSNIISTVHHYVVEGNTTSQKFNCVSPQVTNYSYIFRVSLEDDAMFVAVEFFHRKKCNLLRIFLWVYPSLPLQQVLQNRKFKQHNWDMQLSFSQSNTYRNQLLQDSSWVFQMLPFYIWCSCGIMHYL